MLLRITPALTAGCLLLVSFQNTGAQEEQLRETGSSELERSFRGETQASGSGNILDSNPLFQVEEMEVLENTTTTTTNMNTNKKHWNVFERRHNPDFAGDFSMRTENKPHKAVTVFSEQRLGVQSRYDDGDLLWGSTSERYEYVDTMGARVKPAEGFSLGARMETRTDLPQDNQDIVTRDNMILEGSYDPWKKGTVTLGVENPTVSNWTNDEQLEHNQVYRAEYRQGIFDLPVTTTVGTRMFERYDPEAGLEDPISSSPQLSGAVDWKPDDQVLFRVGGRGEQVEDALGAPTSEVRHVFAEYNQNLMQNLDFRSRVAMEESTQFSSGVIDTETNRAEVRMGPSWKMSDTFNADLEVFRSWEDNAATSGFQEQENRVSFSIRGEF